MTGLRRTALQRRTELRRGAPRRQQQAVKRVAIARRTVEKQRRQAKDTGPSAATKGLLWLRAGGRCERCGRDLTGGAAFSRHHRRPRGSGGSSVEWINDVSNLLLLCGTGTTNCHGWVEAHPTESYREGWKISLHSTRHPSTIAVRLGVCSGILAERVLLTTAGTYDWQAS